MSAEIILEERYQADALQKFVQAVRRQEDDGRCVAAVGILLFHDLEDVDADGVTIQTWANMPRAELADFLRSVADDIHMDVQSEVS